MRAPLAILAMFEAAWHNFWFAPVSPAPVCLFRILAGLIAFIDSLLWFPDILLWSGRHGIIPNSVMQHFHYGVCVYALWDFSDQQMLALLVVQTLASLLWCVGYFSRTSAFVVWMMFCSLNFREAIFWHQDGLFIRLYSFLLIFAPAGAMYSVDSFLKKRRGQDTGEPKLYAPVAQRLLQVQVAFVYFRAAVGKFMGDQWRDGTATYYVLHHTTTIRHIIPPIFDHLWFYQLTSWYTLFIETCLWTLIWVPPINKLVLLGAVFLHCGIEWFINLDLLEWAIMSTYILFLPPIDIEKFMGWLARVFRVRQGNRAGATAAAKVDAVVEET